MHTDRQPQDAAFLAIQLYVPAFYCSAPVDSALTTCIAADASASLQHTALAEACTNGCRLMYHACVQDAQPKVRVFWCLEGCRQQTDLLLVSKIHLNRCLNLVLGHPSIHGPNGLLNDKYGLISI